MQSPLVFATDTRTIHIIIQMWGDRVAVLKLFHGRAIASFSRVACQEVAVCCRYLFRALPTIGNKTADNGGAFEPTFCFVDHGCMKTLEASVVRCAQKPLTLVQRIELPYKWVSQDTLGSQNFTRSLPSLASPCSSRTAMA
jgi:hypothetical protein